MKIPASLGRKLLAFLDDEDTRHDEAYALAASLRRYNQPKRSLRPSRERREAKKAGRREEMADIRAQVWGRADGKCENCRVCIASSLDHILGGSGRRRAEQSVETTWALCMSCDYRRTNNNPSAEAWVAAFNAHADRHGYPHIKRLTRKPLESSR